MLTREDIDWLAALQAENARLRIALDRIAGIGRETGRSADTLWRVLAVADVALSHPAVRILR